MAYTMPYASQGFCEPTSMTQIPHGPESLSSTFDFGTASAIWEPSQDPTKPFDLQRVTDISLSIPELFGPSSDLATGFITAPTLSPIPSAQFSGYRTSLSTFPQPDETLRLSTSQSNIGAGYTVPPIPVPPTPVPSAFSIPFWEKDRIVPVCHRDHAQERSVPAARASRRTSSRLSRRHSPYACTNHPVSISLPSVILVSEPVPRSRKRPIPPSPSPSPSTPAPSKPKKARTCTPLPDTLLPIKILPASGSLPRCPMPKCGLEIEACDAAWRGHFKAMHHDDLCLAPGCDAASASPSPRCMARCPCPLPGSKGKACERGAMAVESVGRHLLNVHVGVAYACPLCGVERTWRESACARHIRLCMTKRTA